MYFLLAASSTPECILYSTFFSSLSSCLGPSFKLQLLFTPLHIPSAFAFVYLACQAQMYTCIAQSAGRSTPLSDEEEAAAAAKAAALEKGHTMPSLSRR